MAGVVDGFQSRPGSVEVKVKRSDSGREEEKSKSSRASTPDKKDLEEDEEEGNDTIGKGVNSLSVRRG